MKALVLVALLVSSHGAMLDACTEGSPAAGCSASENGPDMSELMQRGAVVKTQQETGANVAEVAAVITEKAEDGNKAAEMFADATTADDASEEEALNDEEGDEDDEEDLEEEELAPMALMEEEPSDEEEDDEDDDVEHDNEDESALVEEANDEEEASEDEEDNEKVAMSYEATGGPGKKFFKAWCPPGGSWWCAKYSSKTAKYYKKKCGKKNKGKQWWKTQCYHKSAAYFWRLFCKSKTRKCGKLKSKCGNAANGQVARKYCPKAKKCLKGWYKGYVWCRKDGSKLHKKLYDSYFKCAGTVCKSKGLKGCDVECRSSAKRKLKKEIAKHAKYR